MENVLAKYTDEYEKIRLKKEFPFGLAQKFVASLLALTPEERYQLLPLFKQIENNAFEDGIEIPNLNYVTIVQDKSEWETSAKLRSVIKKEKKPVAESDFNKVLFHFFSKYDLALNRVKGYFLFRAENSDNSPTKVRILYDDEFNKHPEINSFDTEEPEYDLKKSKLREFSDSAAMKDEIRNQNYLFVFLITSHLRDNKELIDNIKGLIGLFSNNYIAIKRKPVQKPLDFEFRPVDDGYRAIKSFSEKVFNNREISFEEESILKKFFPGTEMILDYKILKKGNSGSKVIEIQPLKVDSPKMTRFVVKYSAIDAERKILEEKERYDLHVRNCGVSGYSADYNQTDMHEAIMYNYASSDSKTDSNPFSKLLNESISDKYNYPYPIEKVIEELFGCAPYQKWNTNINGVTEPVKILYRDYIKSEARILKAIALIKGIDESKVSAEELVRNYYTIIEFQLKTQEKICHGDLHSENFFKDEQGVYLIDFGWTNKHPSTIDHATLECSLKFKHLPLYIPIDDLISCENELLSIESFEKSFDLTFIKRQSIMKISKLIVQIRENAKQYMNDKANPLEYLISLFIINFRQIQYSDLNQAYAFATAEILSRKIVELIELPVQ